MSRAYLNDVDRPEQQPRGERDRRREHEHRRIDRDFERRGQVLSGQREQQRQADRRYAQADDAAHEPEQHALEEQAASDRASRGAQRGANRELVPADLGSHELKIRDVGASDQEQHADGAHEHPQHVVQIADDVVLQRAQIRAELHGVDGFPREARHDRVAVEVDRDHARHVGGGLPERHAFLEPRDAALPVDGTNGNAPIRSARESRCRPAAA